MAAHRVVAALGVPFATLVLAFGCNSLVGLDDLRKVDCVGPSCTTADTGPSTDAGDALPSDAPTDSPSGSCSANPDPTTAAQACGPKELSEKTCSPTDGGAGCPSGTFCGALTRNDLSSDIVNLRMTHLLFWYPPVLRKVAPFLVHPQTNAKCAGGQEVLNQLLQFDTVQKKLKVGSARPSTDGVTFHFLTETFPASYFAEACPGATRLPPAAIELKPYQVPFTISAANFTTDTMARMFIASFDTTKKVPSIVPIVDVSLKKLTLSADRNCIGSFDPNYGCIENDSLGWTTGGLIVGKIPLEEADDIPVPIGGCQSLCAVLADNPDLVDGANCKRVGGKLVEFGDTCVGGTGCKNAMWVSAAFSAHAVKIE